MYTFERNWYIRYLCVSENILPRDCRQAPLASGFRKTRPNCPCPIAFLSRTHGIEGQAPYTYIWKLCNKCAPHKCACVLRLFLSAPPSDFLQLSVYICRVGHNKVQARIKYQNRFFNMEIPLNGSL